MEGCLAKLPLGLRLYILERCVRVLLSMTIDSQNFKCVCIWCVLSKVDVGKAVMFDEVVGNGPLAGADS